MTTRPAVPNAVEIPVIWHFANAVLNERTLELRVAGALVQLERKPVELLRLLLRNANEVVTRDELLEAVWPGRIATEASLAKAVSRVRQELGDSEQTLIRTVHGYGYRLVADVRIEHPDGERDAAAPRRFAFQPGMAVPERPSWQLKGHLASGGQGEVWLAEQPKSGEQRVLKFASDAGGLLALKREITLCRLLREAVGPAARAVRMIDWNLETEPFFTESEHVPGGSFVHWAAMSGGLAQVPITVRFELLAQAAEALAAAHSVGVLHRDLKPQNLLIDDRDADAPEVRLADLGSGGLSEPTALDRYAITRMGLTDVLANRDSDSGTPIYRAPELLAGQMPTARADIHALGVMLYQCAVGDFARPMAVGWEADIDDPVLRADIASAAAGNPALRLADAAEFAHRLRHLDERRAAWRAAEARREVERAALAAAEIQRQENERLKTRRFWLRATVAVLLVGLGASLWLYREARIARDAAQLATRKAEASAATADAVTGFFTDDLKNSAIEFEQNARTATILQLFEALAKKVDSRFGGEPEAEARARIALAAVFEIFSEAYEQDEIQLQKAYARFIEVAERDGVRAVRLLAGLSEVNFMPSLTTPQLRRLQAVLDDVDRAHAGDPALDREVLAAARTDIARDLGLSRDDPQAGVRLLDQLIARPDYSAERGFQIRRSRAALLRRAGEQKAALAQYQTLLADPQAEQLMGGPFYFQRMQSEAGSILLELGETDEAERLISNFIDEQSKGAIENLGTLLRARYLHALLRAAQGRSKDAAAEMAAIHPALVEKMQEGAAGELGVLIEADSLRIDALLLAGEPAAALRAAREELALLKLADSRVAGTSKTSYFVPVWLHGADALVANGDLDGARSLLAELPPEALAGLPAQHPLRADKLRVEAALAEAEGKPAEARRLLQQAEAQLLAIFNVQSWRVARVRTLLAGLPSA